MTNESLYECMKDEARALLSEIKRFQLISEKNPICREAAELLTSLRNRLNVIEHFTDEAGKAMRQAAESHHSTLEQDQQRPKWKPSRTVSPGERAKRQAVKRGAILVRSV
ncbi:hypothetical protein OP658_002900 [Cronobacter sakazakii]|nr:hypothetical protein [Cronobacter sakazakii]EIX1762577.1 hypothetical protein [Cronobacter sakazakii]EIX6120012.1 hypothetical protein [Cronobacter sakazakii]EIX6208626.1 hypothetical protein [Cronobacter sakazakii]EJQ0793803.1 hypothetical protein [Cronobacter sakazakii]